MAAAAAEIQGARGGDGADDRLQRIEIRPARMHGTLHIGFRAGAELRIDQVLVGFARHLVPS